VKTLGVIVMTLSLAACAGNRWFAGDNQFQDYVAKLHLSQMSMPQARAKLSSLGFICKPRSNDVSCSKPVDGGHAAQYQHVLLSPQTEQGSSLKVKADLGVVVI